jgi:hypothetical protein
VLRDAPDRQPRTAPQRAQAVAAYVRGEGVHRGS